MVSIQLHRENGVCFLSSNGKWWSGDGWEKYVYKALKFTESELAEVVGSMIVAVGFDMQVVVGGVTVPTRTERMTREKLIEEIKKLDNPSPDALRKALVPLLRKL